MDNSNKPPKRVAPKNRSERLNIWKDCDYCAGLFLAERFSHKYCSSDCWKSASVAVPYQFDLFDIPGRGRRSPGVSAS